MVRRSGPRHLGLAVATALAVLFALGPIITIVTFSFNTSRFYALPIQGLTLRWYEELLDAGNQLRVTAGMVYGIKKTRFASQDYATIVLSTWAE